MASCQAEAGEGASESDCIHVSTCLLIYGFNFTSAKQFMYDYNKDRTEITGFDIIYFGMLLFYVCEFKLFVFLLITVSPNAHIIVFILLMTPIISTTVFGYINKFIEFTVKCFFTVI